SKILCPEKKVLLRELKAGCSLAVPITGADVGKLKERHTGIAEITYVNSSAEDKAEIDVCCTSSNALKIVNALGTEGHDTVIMNTDKYLAQNVAAETDVKVIIWDGTCMVHERFTAKDVETMRKQHNGIMVLAHPECPPEVIEAADYAGSTSQIDDFIKAKK